MTAPKRSPDLATSGHSFAHRIVDIDLVLVDGVERPAGVASKAILIGDRLFVDHPFGTLKMRMGATHFLMKRLPIKHPAYS
jgi:hypothetical protein